MKKIVKYSSLAALGLVAAGLLAACSGGEKKYSCFCQRYGAGEKVKVLFILNIKSSRDLLYKKGRYLCESGFSSFL